VNFPQRKSFKKQSSHWLAVSSELLAPALRLGARLAVPIKAAPASEWKRALIVGDMHIGDLLYRTCSLVQLKRGLPRCEFYYLAADGAAEVLAGNPALAGILPLRNSDRMFDLKNGAWERLRGLQFDAILCTSAIRAWPELAFALKLQIPNRAAYAHRGLSGLITHPVFPRHPQSLPGYFRDMVSALTGQPPDWPLQPVVYPDNADREEAEKLWLELGFKPSEKVIACFVTARQTKGMWPVEWFGEVLQTVQKNCGCRIVLCGANGDKDKLQELRRQFNLSAELNPGLLGLKSLVAFLSKCSLTLTQDSGPRHLSNAAGIPVVFPRNTYVDAIETGRYCETEIDMMPPEINRLPVEEQNTILEMLPAAKGVETILSLFHSTEPHVNRFPK
jgi:ADP-heptose:LPS heptosyltransferase